MRGAGEIKRGDFKTSGNFFYRLAQLRALADSACHFLARPKKWRKKGAKGPNALWIPAMRKGRAAVALLIFSQK